MTPETIGQIASRYDTTMSRAMLRCLERMGVGYLRRDGTRAYDHLIWCFRNVDVPCNRKRKMGL